MSEPPAEPADEEREARRRKLTGRLIVAGFGLLVLAYVVVTFIR